MQQVNLHPPIPPRLNFKDYTASTCNGQLKKDIFESTITNLVKENKYVEVAELLRSSSPTSLEQSKLPLINTAVAISQERNALQMVRLLVMYKCSPHIEVANGFTPIHIAVCQGYTSIVKELIQYCRVDINQPNKEGVTVLMHAAHTGNAEMVDLLTKSGANSNAADRNMTNALHWAALSGSELIVQMLLENGADIDAKDINHYTALIFAARAQHTKVCCILLQRGARSDITNRKGQTITDICPSLQKYLHTSTNRQLAFENKSPRFEMLAQIRNSALNKLNSRNTQFFTNTEETEDEISKQDKNIGSTEQRNVMQPNACGTNWTTMKEAIKRGVKLSKPISTKQKMPNNNMSQNFQLLEKLKKRRSAIDVSDSESTW